MMMVMINDQLMLLRLEIGGPSLSWGRWTLVSVGSDGLVDFPGLDDIGRRYW